MTATLSGLITNVGTVLTFVLDAVVDIFDVMITSPIMIVIVSCAVIGTVIAFSKKILG